MSATYIEMHQKKDGLRDRQGEDEASAVSH